MPNAALDLFRSDRTREPPRFRYLVGLDVRLPSFVRLASQRIGEMCEAADIEAALAEVPAEFLRIVETMTVTAIGYRIAQMQMIEDRREALAALPASLRPRVEPHLARLYQSKPWLKKTKAKGD